MYITYTYILAHYLHIYIYISQAWAYYECTTARRTRETGKTARSTATASGHGATAANLRETSSETIPSREC